jgi:futalosine hydrolase
MDFIVCTATEMELSRFKQVYAPTLSHINISYVLHGIGAMVAGTNIAHLMQQYSHCFIVQIGIAGSLTSTLPIGHVVAVATEQEGNLGVQEPDGFKNLMALDLAQHQPDMYSKQLIYHNHAIATLQPYLSNNTILVHGVTVQQITTDTKTVERYKLANISIETMEGAALHYNANICNRQYIQLRGISNAVMERDKTFWNIPLALEAVAKEAYVFIKNIYHANQHS